MQMGHTQKMPSPRALSPKPLGLRLPLRDRRDAGAPTVARSGQAKLKSSRSCRTGVWQGVDQQLGWVFYWGLTFCIEASVFTCFALLSRGSNLVEFPRFAKNRVSTCTRHGRLWGQYSPTHEAPRKCASLFWRKQKLSASAVLCVSACPRWWRKWPEHTVLKLSNFIL